MAADWFTQFSRAANQKPPKLEEKNIWPNMIHLLFPYIYFFFFYRDEMRNTFNLLLISMIAFDSWYLLGSILENFRRNFGLGSQLHTILFPKFLYPAMSVAMSGSIFMTVAISLERYFAVHHPIGNKINTTLSSVFQFYDLKYKWVTSFLTSVCSIWYW